MYLIIVINLLYYCVIVCLSACLSVGRPVCLSINWDRALVMKEGKIPNKRFLLYPNLFDKCASNATASTIADSTTISETIGEETESVSKLPRVVIYAHDENVSLRCRIKMIYTLYT